MTAHSLAGQMPARHTPPAPLTGAQRLAAALADLTPLTRDRVTFTTLTAAVPRAAARLAAPDAPLIGFIARYGHARDRGRLNMSRRYVAADLLHAAIRALSSSPNTLRLLAGDRSVELPPVERRGLTAALHRTALIAGINLDAAAQQALTDAVLTALGDTLAQP